MTYDVWFTFNYRFLLNLLCQCSKGMIFTSRQIIILRRELRHNRRTKSEQSEFRINDTVAIGNPARILDVL